MKVMTKNKSGLRLLAIVYLGLALLVSGCVTTDGDGAKTEEKVTSNKDKADIYAQLANGYLKNEQFETAQGELKKALAISPDHSQSNYMMGLLLIKIEQYDDCLLYTSPSPRDQRGSRMPSSA